MRSDRITSVLFGLLIANAGAPVLHPAAAQVDDGVVLAAFVPQLTGDPEQDFTRTLEPGASFTIYVIAGALQEAVSAYRFGLEFSEAASVLLGEVRALGDVLAFQNSIGTFVSVGVTAPIACLQLESESVLAEIDLVLHEAGGVSVRLVGADAVDAPPQYRVCGGVDVAFDHTKAPDLRVTAPEVVLERVTWGAVKALYGSR
jgi:hypothetical protein